MRAATKVPRLPLWRLEMLREQALRRFRRAEDEFEAAGLALRQVEDEIEQRRKEQA